MYYLFLFKFKIWNQTRNFILGNKTVIIMYNQFTFHFSKLFCRSFCSLFNFSTLFSWSVILKKEIHRILTHFSQNAYTTFTECIHNFHRIQIQLSQNAYTTFTECIHNFYRIQTFTECIHKFHKMHTQLSQNAHTTFHFKSHFPPSFEYLIHSSGVTNFSVLLAPSHLLVKTLKYIHSSI